jgi:hypothetical protein
VSLPEEYPVTSRGSAKDRRAHAERISDTTVAMPLPDNASTALDRIEIPQPAIEQISELVTPGSSVTGSDYGISRETGKDTDFIVVIH